MPSIRDLNPYIRTELEKIEGRYELVQGRGDHIKIFIDNRMACITPAGQRRSESPTRAGLNVVSAIRRAARKGAGDAKG